MSRPETRPATDEELIRTLQQHQIEFESGNADGPRSMQLLRETMLIQQELRRRGVSDIVVAEAIAAITQHKPQ